MDVEQAQAKHRHRGKLYALSDDSAWEDTGTGFAVISGTGDARRLVFQEEESGKVLHDRPVFDSSAYQLQGEGERHTIIVWEDAETQKDWALSFQDAEGTAEIWEAICGEAVADEKRMLPLPSLANLQDLCRKLTCVPPNMREVLAGECMSAKFINGLRETFHMAEDVCSDEALTALWQITKGIFLLSNQKLTERYLQPDVYEDIFGMLEHDGGLPSNKRIPHRQVLRGQVQFKQVLTFEDAETLERIHLNYRLQYLKDIALPRLLDDAAFVSLTQMIHMNLTSILEHLQTSNTLLEQLFLQIRQKNRQSLHFLQDVCRLAKQIAPGERQALHEKMVAQHMFAVLVPFLAEDGADSAAEPQSLAHACVEVLLLSTQNDPMHLRRFLTADNSAEGRLLMNALVRVVHRGDDQGVQSQAAELLKFVMDITALEARDRDACLDTFYDNGVLDELMAPLRSEALSKQPLGPCALFGLQLICELLAFAVTHHGFRARVYVIRHGVVQHSVRLLAVPNRFLQLAPVRLLYATVSSKDDAYHRYLMKCGFFAPVLRAFEESVRPPALGGNLLVSATLQVLELIRIENIKILVDHICRKHEALLREHSAKYRTLQLLLLKHQQNLEYEAFPPEQHASGGPIVNSSRGSGAMRSGRVRSPGRDDSDDDEAYFESLDDDDDDDDAGPQRSSDANGSATSQSSPGQHGEAAGNGGAADASEEPSAPAPSSHGAEDDHGGAAAAEGVLSPAPRVAENSLQGLLGGYEDEDDKDDAASGHAAESVAAPASTGAEEAGACSADQPSQTAPAESTEELAAVAAGLPSPLRNVTPSPSGALPSSAATPGAEAADSVVGSEAVGGECSASHPTGAPTEAHAATTAVRTATASDVDTGDTCHGPLAASAAAEKAPNHASKRLKTSASAVEAPA